jgi:hypothetical protein
MATSGQHARSGLGGRSPLLRLARPSLALALLGCLVGAPLASALDFEMTTQTKCVYEEINAGALVVGDYSVAHRDTPTQAVFADVRVSGLLVAVLFGCSSLSKLPI